MASPPTRILVIDDEEEIRYSLQRVLSARNYEVLTAGSGEEGIECARENDPEAILLDLRMGGISGMETLQHLKGVAPRSMVILMTAFGTTQTAIEAMKYGAFDYVIKPFELKKILSLVEGAVQASQDLRGAGLEEQAPLIDAQDYKEGIVGSSEAMQEVFKMIGQVAGSEVTVMVTGESGTGKELVARCIGQHSHRSEQTFIAVNCAAIPENLIESELFGHEKGAFTGATTTREGKFELCDGGTLFLDEIGDMSLPTQTKILRAIQEGEIQRVGGTKTIKVDVRLIAATNKDLEKMVADGEFREDLYYRLNVVRIRLPSLRERSDDIPQLIDFMLQKLEREKKSRARRVSADVLKLLTAYRWPGNVRELENVIYRSAVIAQGDTILIKDLPAELQGIQSEPETAPEPVAEAEEVKVPEAAPVEAEEAPVSQADATLIGLPRSEAAAPSLTLSEAWDLAYKLMREESDNLLLDFSEKEIIRRALDECGGNQVKTSALLGITRATLRKRIESHGI